LPDFEKGDLTEISRVRVVASQAAEIGENELIMASQQCGGGFGLSLGGALTPQSGLWI